MILNRTQYLFKMLYPYGLATTACAAAGLVLMITASPAMAQDGQHMMGEHSQGMMGNMPGQGIMDDSDHRQEMMMGADGNMMGHDNHHMTTNDRSMRGRDGQ